MKWQSNKPQHFRIDNGEVMLLTADQDMAGLKNRHHFSKETVFARHASHIVPIGSPLGVWNVKQDDMKIAYMLYF